MGKKIFIIIAFVMMSVSCAYVESENKLIACGKTCRKSGRVMDSFKATAGEILCTCIDRKVK